MVFWFDAEVFKDRVGPEAFHVILCMSGGVSPAQNWGKTYPVLNLSMPYRIMYAIAYHSQLRINAIAFLFYTRPTRGNQCLVSNKEIQVLSSSLRGQSTTRTGSSSEERRLICDGRPARPRSTSSSRTAFRCYCCWKNEGRRIIARKTLETSGSSANCTVPLLEETHQASRSLSHCSNISTLRPTQL